MKRSKISKNVSKKIFRKSGGMMNSENVPKIARGGIRY